MKQRWLLDVNALVGLLWSSHALHGRAQAWFGREAPTVVGCVFTELSFIRVSMADRTIAASFVDAELAIAQFTKTLGPRYEFIARLPSAQVLRGQAVRTHHDVSDFYLCELALANGAKLATLDARIRHPAAVIIG